MLLYTYYLYMYFSLKIDNKEDIYVFDSAIAPVFPAEMHEGVLGLVDIQQSLPFIGVHHLSFHRHFSSFEFN